MNESGVGATRRVLAVAALCLVLAAICVLLFYYGRQHKVIIDNRSVELADGQTFRALAGARVAVNHQTLDPDEISASAVPPSARPLVSFKFWPSPDPSIAHVAEMMPRERILVKVLGPSFNLKFEALDNAGESLGAKEETVHLGFRRDAMVRLVKLHRDLPDFLEPYPDDTIGRRPPPDETPPAEPEGAPPSLGDA